MLSKKGSTAAGIIFIVLGLTIMFGGIIFVVVAGSGDLLGPQKQKTLCTVAVKEPLILIPWEIQSATCDVTTKCGFLDSSRKEGSGNIEIRGKMGNDIASFKYNLLAGTGQTTAVDLEFCKDPDVHKLTVQIYDKGIQKASKSFDI